MYLDLTFTINDMNYMYAIVWPWKYQNSIIFRKEEKGHCMQNMF